VPSEFARELRRNSTGIERILWDVLRNRRLAGLKFRRQVPLGRYVADFACFSPKMIVEADGSQHEGSRYDAARDAWFSERGFAVLRFWNHEVTGNPDAVLDRIIEVSTRLSGRTEVPPSPGA
jgi:very-short-patch-repair endonuclease